MDDYSNQLTLFGSNALHITLYDISGAPLDPNKANELIEKAQELAKTEYSLATDIRWN